MGEPTENESLPEEPPPPKASVVVRPSASLVGPPVESARVDRWLWAARLAKTRSQGAKLCAGGHVKVNGDTAKASKTVRPGDRVEVVLGERKVVVVIRFAALKRGPAAAAQALYEDHSPPPPPREERDFGRRDRGTGRPSKRDRRTLLRLRGRK